MSVPISNEYYSHGYITKKDAAMHPLSKGHDECPLELMSFRGRPVCV